MSSNQYGIASFKTTAASGNPRMSALEAMNNTAAKQVALNNAAGGSRRRRRGGQATVTLPQAPAAIYRDPNANTSFGTGNQIKSAMIGTMNQNSQSEYDSKVQLAPVVKMGGRSKKFKKRGGFIWPCLSGGRRKTIRKSRRKTSKKSSRRRR